jgi:Bacterial nucleoid DNA-binding protein
MNRAEFIKTLAKQRGMSRWEAYHSVNAVMDTLRLLLADGHKIEIGGFGTFEILTDLKGEHIPTFKGGRALKRVLNVKTEESS